MKKLIPFILVLLLGVALGFFGNRAIKKPIQPPIVRVDTLYRVDTFVTEKPTPKYITVVDSLYVPVYTPEWVHDTIMVAVPKEQKVYQDSTYRAVVSGYKPSLDEIEVYQKTVTIESVTIMPRKKIGFSVGAGPAIIYSPFTKGIDAGVGVFGGVTYTF